MAKKIHFNFSSPKIIYLIFFLFLFFLFGASFIFLYFFAYQPEQQIPFLLKSQQETALSSIDYSLLQKVKKSYSQKINAPDPLAASSTFSDPFSSSQPE